jgi:hypothetical protein
VEARLAGEPGGFTRDARAVEAEIARVEESLARAAPPGAPAATEGRAIGALLAEAAAALGGEPARQLERLAARAGELAGALSGGRLGVTIEGGCAKVIQGGRAVAEARAAPPDQDLCFLAARLAVLERALAAGECVALVDDVFAGLPEATRRLVARLLRSAAQGAQILHATTDPAFRDDADHVAA